MVKDLLKDYLEHLIELLHLEIETKFEPMQ